MGVGTVESSLNFGEQGSAKLEPRARGEARRGAGTAAARRDAGPGGGRPGGGARGAAVPPHHHDQIVWCLASKPHERLGRVRRPASKAQSPVCQVPRGDEGGP